MLISDQQLLINIKEAFWSIFDKNEQAAFNEFYILVSQYNHKLTEANMTNLYDISIRAQTRTHKSFKMMHGLYE